ncbi:hypothetical protein FHX49_000867 [Microbacterium endophyticum]|uniref:Uncharacterized protein n=1 Tax=Microbacterium endophyticum TaxID=1526412 RepID=A0A7W4V1S7_9MICO|nr:hypothetical protein [Microbacterium endophyticum]MBB2975301.1 hypothetical protein [Microbacterium endophyticum]NIK35680.1 hypothetical protein [Microbacterium endophyticum]
MDPRPVPESTPEPSTNDALFASVPRIDVVDGELLPGDRATTVSNSRP